MKEYPCCVPSCHSLCVLSRLDEERAADALKERGWVLKYTFSGKPKAYCPQHLPPKVEEEKKDAEPVPPAE